MSFIVNDLSRLWVLFAKFISKYFLFSEFLSVNEGNSFSYDDILKYNSNEEGNAAVGGDKVSSLAGMWPMRGVLVIILFFCSLFGISIEGGITGGLRAQSTYYQFKKGERLQEWNYQRNASYQEAKQIFLAVYGNNPEGWPLFVRRAIELNREYVAYENERRQPGHTFYLNFLVEKDKGLDKKLNRNFYYRGYHPSHIRNYYSLFSFYYPTRETNSDTKISTRYENKWAKIRNGSDYIPDDEKEMILSYIKAAERGGDISQVGGDAITVSGVSGGGNIFPALLYQFTYGTPPALLEWCYTEVFAVLDHIFAQESRESLEKVLESVYKHIEELHRNSYHTRAKIWTNALSNFISYYDMSYDIHVPDYANYNRYSTNLSRIMHETNDKNQKLFTSLYKDYLERELGKLSYNVPMIINTNEDKVYRANLRFERDDNGYFRRVLYVSRGNDDPPFLKHLNYKISAYNQFSHGYVSMIAAKNANKYKFVTSDGNIDFFETKELERYNDIIAMRDKYSGDNIIRAENAVPVEGGYQWFYNSEASRVDIDYPSTYERNIDEAVRVAFMQAVNEIWGTTEVVPTIYGMDFKKPVQYRYKLTFEADSIYLKADGVSFTPLTATLYRYDAADPESIEALSGVPLNFDIQLFKGFKAGSLSSELQATNNEGIAAVVYKVPDAEELKSAPEEARYSATLKVSNSEYDVEELLYVTFKADKGRVEAFPSNGILSEECIVPPDKRYPALIKFRMEGDNLDAIEGEEVTFSIEGGGKYGVLKSETGGSGSSVTVTTDDQGYAQVQYFYEGDKSTSGDLRSHDGKGSGGDSGNYMKERILIETSNSAIPFTADVYIGLNLVFDSAESAYEGKGVVNAGERIPLKVKVKDAASDLKEISEVVNYWGGGGLEGDHPLRVRLEIERLGSVPDYLLDHLRADRYPLESSFGANMQVRTFKEAGVSNLLWMPEVSVYDYKGYPLVQPQISGKNYYELRLILTDGSGNPIYPGDHPASRAFITIETGVSANALDIFINENPFGPNTPEAKLLRNVLNFKCGSVLSITDALDAINRGDTENLYRILFSEVKGFLMAKVGDIGDKSSEIVGKYSTIAYAEQFYTDMASEPAGPLAQIDDIVFEQIKQQLGGSVSPAKIVILEGDGRQELIVTKEASKSSKSSDKKNSEKKSMFGIKITGIDKKTEESLKKTAEALKGAANLFKGSKAVPVGEGKFLTDEDLGTTSYKKGGITIYLIPEGMEYKAENFSRVRSF